MNTQILLLVGMILGWVLAIIFLILWSTKKSKKVGYDENSIYQIRKELRNVHENLKGRLEGIRKELYEIFVAIDKLLIKM